MKRTELIKNAINSRVIIKFINDGDREYRGWLVINHNIKNTYLLLPFTPQPVEYEAIWSLCVSHVKHLTYIDNGYRLW